MVCLNSGSGDVVEDEISRMVGVVESAEFVEVGEGGEGDEDDEDVERGTGYHHRRTCPSTANGLAIGSSTGSRSASVHTGILEEILLRFLDCGE